MSDTNTKGLKKVNENFDVVVIGGGASGMAAALEASKSGSVLLLDRNATLGGVLCQCLHDGFETSAIDDIKGTSATDANAYSLKSSTKGDTSSTNKTITGVEYSKILADKLSATETTVILEAAVLSINSDRQVFFTSPSHGQVCVKAGSIILATGTRERTRGDVRILGSRPSGIFVSTTAHYYINTKHKSIGKKIVVAGSHNNGLMVARRLKLTGAQVIGVYETNQNALGDKSYVDQCLNAQNIPLHTSHKITEIVGKNRVEGIKVAKLDKNKNIIAGTEQIVECDTLMLNVGMIAENELALESGAKMNLDHNTPLFNTPITDKNNQTSLKGIYVCGSADGVSYDVSKVVKEGARVGKVASEYACKKI